MLAEPYDLVLVGTGFASSFFLQGYLAKAPRSARVLVLERGALNSLSWQLGNGRNSDVPSSETFVNKTPEKEWVTNIGFGGGSNCWWACTPRMMPNDFRVRSEYGVGTDWPISYDELEPFYVQAEETMAISGSLDPPFPMSRPYPQPAHLLSDAEKALQKAYPDTFFPQPTARARRDTPTRSACCASGVCSLCPVGAKFSIVKDMFYVYEDDRVTWELNAQVRAVSTQAGVAIGVEYTQNGADRSARGELIALGTNALYNPHLLIQSGLDHPVIGRFLNEQVSVMATIDLDGLDHYGGSTSITGHGYMLYDGPHRSDRAACLIETHNVPHRPFALRLERGKYLQRIHMKFIFETLPEERNRVTAHSDDPALPATTYHGHSDYTQRAFDALERNLPELLRPLPVESVDLSHEFGKTESHIGGTTTMSRDPDRGIVDRYLIHHQIRNLLVLGSGTFPTSSPANPTLTLSALSLWSANHLFAS